MRKIVVPAVMLFATCFSGAVLSIQKDITITGTVDNSINVTQVNGTELPSAVKMDYTPGQGLAPVSIPVTIFNNAAGGDTPKGVNVKLSTAPQLTLLTDNTTTEDLEVTLGGAELSLSDVLFDNTKAQYDPTSKKSQQLNLVIQQKIHRVLPKAGLWQGNIGVVLTPQL